MSADSLQKIDVAAGMVADAGDELNFVRQFHQVVVGAVGKTFGLDSGLFLRRENDQRDFSGVFIFPKFLDQRHAVNLRHNKVLEDDGGAHAFRLCQRFGWIGAVVVFDVAFREEHSPDGFSDHRLVVDQQNPNG